MNSLCDSNVKIRKKQNFSCVSFSMKRNLQIKLNLISPMTAIHSGRNELTIIEARLATSVMVTQQQLPDPGLCRLTRTPDSNIPSLLPFGDHGLCLTAHTFPMSHLWMPTGRDHSSGLRDTNTHFKHNTHKREKAGGPCQLRRVEECNNSWKVEQEREQGEGGSLSLSLSLSLSISLSRSHSHTHKE